MTANPTVEQTLITEEELNRLNQEKRVEIIDGMPVEGAGTGKLQIVAAGQPGGVGHLAGKPRTASAAQRPAHH